MAQSINIQNVAQDFYFIWKIKGFNMAQSVVLVITSTNVVFFDIKRWIYNYYF